MKKIMALCLVVAMAVVAVGGATLAYFTDTKSATNTFTLGNVKIALHEGAYENVQKNGAPIDGEGQLDLSKANPEANKTTAGFGYDYLDASYTSWLALQTLMPGSQDFNRMQKRVFVENTGDYAAYVRVIVGIPQELDNTTDASKNILHVNQVTGPINNNLGHWVKNDNVPPVASDDTYNYYAYYYTEALAGHTLTDAEAISYFWLDGKVDYNNETGKYFYTTEKGEIVPLTSIVNGKINIPVYAEAIQAAGFDTYTAAWTAYGAPAFLAD